MRCCFFPSCSPYSVDQSPPSDDLVHISNKHTMRFNQNQPTSSSSSSSPQWSTASRIRLYPPPQPTQNLKRHVHAPCRKPNFFSSNSGRVKNHSKHDSRSWRSSLFRGYSPFQYFKKDKVIIDLEPEEEASKDKSSKNFSVIEIHNLISSDDQKEIEILDQRSLEEEDDALMQGPSANVTSYRSSSVVSGSSDSGLKVEDVGKMFESMSVHNGVAEDLPHQKVLKSAEKPNSRWNESVDINLNLEISLASEPAKKPNKEIFKELFCVLTKEEDAGVTAAFSSSNRRKTLVTHQASNIEITGEILQCLRPGGWLNDEVINLYLELLKEREEREPNKFLKCHFFNTFFYRKLITGSHGYDFKAIRRWTTPRKIGYGLIECDKIFVPIHKPSHWCLAVINRKDKKFQYLDSLKGMDTQVLKVLAKYYVDEVKDKGAQDIDVSSWGYENVHDLPKQENGFDCGMFLIKYIDFYSRGLTLSFGQKHMPYFRRRTAKEILKLKAE